MYNAATAGNKLPNSLESAVSPAKLQTELTNMFINQSELAGKVFDKEMEKKLHDFYIALGWGNIPTKVYQEYSKDLQKWKLSKLICSYLIILSLSWVQITEYIDTPIGR
jgi:hypothetical protein